MNALNRNALAGAIVLALTAPVVQAQQVFYQGFDICQLESPAPPTCYSSPTAGGPGTYAFAPGWLRMKVDNGTPASDVAFVNDAWVVREDYNFNSNNTAAFSASHSSANHADDWMWSPAIVVPGTSSLSWRAVAYDPDFRDGYEVRVMSSPNTPSGSTGNLGNMVSSSTLVFAIAEEQSSWTDRAVSLAAFSGQTVRIAFRNTSVDKFLLVIDDVKIIDSTPDAIAQAPTSVASEYSRAPDGFSIGTNLGFTTFNGGATLLTNVAGSAQLTLDGNAIGTALQAAPVATLAVGASASEDFGNGHSVRGNGTWTVRYDVSATESSSETNTANNAVEVPVATIGGNELARHEGTPSSVLGLGEGNGGEMGVAFTLAQSTTVAGIRFGLNVTTTVDDGMGHQVPNPFIGKPMVANLRGYDNSPPWPTPDALIASTVAVPASDTVEVYDVAFETGPQLLAPGTYVVTVSQPISSAAMPLNMHTNRFTLGTTWVNWPTSPLGRWGNFEFFAIRLTPEISMLTEMSIFRDGFETAAAASRPGFQASQGPRPVASSRLLRKPVPSSLPSQR